MPAINLMVGGLTPNPNYVWLLALHSLFPICFMHEWALSNKTSLFQFCFYPARSYLGTANPHRNINSIWQVASIRVTPGHRIRGRRQCCGYCGSRLGRFALCEENTNESSEFDAGWHLAERPAKHLCSARQNELERGVDVPLCEITIFVNLGTTF